MAGEAVKEREERWSGVGRRYENRSFGGLENKSSARLASCNGIL